MIKLDPFQTIVKFNCGKPNYLMLFSTVTIESEQKRRLSLRRFSKSAIEEVEHFILEPGFISVGNLGAFVIRFIDDEDQYYRIVKIKEVEDSFSLDEIKKHDFSAVDDANLLEPRVYKNKVGYIVTEGSAPVEKYHVYVVSADDGEVLAEFDLDPPSQEPVITFEILHVACGDDFVALFYQRLVTSDNSYIEIRDYSGSLLQTIVLPENDSEEQLRYVTDMDVSVDSDTIAIIAGVQAGTLLSFQNREILISKKAEGVFSEFESTFLGEEMFTGIKFSPVNNDILAYTTMTSPTGMYVYYPSTDTNFYVQDGGVANDPQWRDDGKYYSGAYRPAPLNQDSTLNVYILPENLNYVFLNFASWTRHAWVRFDDDT
jgi:hypothetical protein